MLPLSVPDYIDAGFAKGKLLVGVDEAGRGPLAGPVTAAAVLFDSSYSNPTITDSKKISPKAREGLYDEIIQHALAYSIVSVGPRRIESLNIRQATRVAMGLASKRLVCAWGASGGREKLHFLVDGNTPMEAELSQETIIKGDALVMCIGAASILAKVTRDRLMKRLDKKEPNYGFVSHQGYPTKKHLQQIETFGPCRYHRRTFRGVKQFL